MASKKARDRKRQTKIDFSRATQSSRSTRQTPKTAVKEEDPNSSSEDGLAAETKRGMRMARPVGSTARGMFDGSDNETDSSKSSEEEEKVAKVKVVRQSRKRRRETPRSESQDED